MCTKYRLQAKRPYEKEYSEWCTTDDLEAVKRNIKVIEGYGYQWKIAEGATMTKEQRREYNRNYYKQTAEKISKRHGDWAKAHRESVNEYHREYAKRDGVKAKRRAYVADWRKRNPEKVREQNKKSYLKKKQTTIGGD